MEFPSPKLKRKKGAGDLRRVLKEEEEQINGRQCRGILLGSSVIIESESDISTLFRLGFYGKGVFSRSVPTHVPSTRSRDSECSSSGGRVGDETRRKRARHHISQSEASEEGWEQRKKRRLLLHAEWTKEKHRLLSLLTETNSVDVTEKLYTPVGVSSTTEDREIPTEVEGGESTASYSPTTTGREVNEIGVNEVGAQATLELKSRSETPAEDPYPVTEPLCLMAEEAFYLAAELNSLRVSLPPPHPSTLHLSPDQLWTRLCEEFSRFPFTYAAYRHYRRKGWVPKTGLKFGVDFILYKDGPDSYHSSYAVLVCEYFEEASEACGSGTVGAGSGKKLRWMDAVAHCRVCESTAKELVVVQVIVPRDCEETGLRSSPDTVDRLRLCETLVTRWVPDKDR